MKTPEIPPPALCELPLIETTRVTTLTVFPATGDFHAPKHICPWKTIIHAAKDTEAIKDCIRHNEHVAITLYRDFAASQPSALSHQSSDSSQLPCFQDRLPLQVANH